MNIHDLYNIKLFYICTLYVEILTVLSMTSIRLFTLVGCSKSNSKSTITTEKLSLDFQKEYSIDAEAKSFPALIDIEDFFVCGNSLVCFSDLDTFAVHCFNLNDFSFQNKLGKRGEGPNEFIEPNIIKSKESISENNIVDSWRFKIIYNNDTIRIDNGLPNDISEINNHLLGYYTLEAGDRCLKIFDKDLKTVTDSISMGSLSEDLKMKPFNWATNGKQIVISFINENIISILHPDIFDNDILLLKGSNLPSGKIAFLSPVCAEDKFYVINNNEVDFKTSSGESEIWSFDYEGNPIERIKTNIIATRMCYDNSNNRLILRGREDDVLYTIHLN